MVKMFKEEEFLSHANLSIRSIVSKYGEKKNDVRNKRSSGMEAQPAKTKCLERICLVIVINIFSVNDIFCTRDKVS